jgi:predicted ATPase
MQAELRHVRDIVSSGGEPSPGPSTDPVAGNLPAVHGAFVGRSKELTQLNAWSDSDASRILSIVGLGGIGKSRLAIEFCHRQSTHFPSGVWRFDLSAVRSTSGLHQTMGAALGLNFDGPEPLDAISGLLRAKADCLLVFDNAEDARPALFALLADLLERVPRMKGIVTTREPLSAPWEAILVLGELDLRESVALLMQAANRTFAFEPHAAASQSLERIAQVLEGHPLSLELAAAQLEMLAPAQLQERLSKSLQTAVSDGPGLVGLLETNAWTEGPPTSSVQASLDWSWSLLSASEQSTLAQCALFSEGFALEAAEAVVDLTGHPQSPPLMVVLQALRSKNLLRLRTPFPGHRRLSVPRLVGSFALSRGNRPERQQSQLRMARHFSLMGQAGRIHQTQTGGLHSHRTARLEISNIQRRFDWAMKHGHGELAALLSLAASALLKRSGPFEEVTEMMRRAQTSLDTDTPLRARLLLERGRLARNREGLDSAKPLLEAAISLSDDVGTASVAVSARVHLAYTLHLTNQISMALKLANTAVAIARQTGNERDLPGAVYCRGHLIYKSGETRKALPDLQAALRGFQRLGDRAKEGECFGNLGEYHHFVGDARQAKQCYENAQAIAIEQGDKASLVRGHRRLAWLHMDAGDWGKAEEALRRGLGLARELGDLPGEASLVGTLGMVAAAADQFELALDRFQKAHGIYQLHGNAGQCQKCLINICFTLEKLDRIDEAFGVLDTLKKETNIDQFNEVFVELIELELLLRREDWLTARELSENLLPKLERLQSWDQTISVHSFRAICEAALGGDPAPHLAKAKATLERLDLAEGSHEGAIMTRAQDRVSQLPKSARDDSSA